MPEGDSKGISRRRRSQRVRAALALLVVATYAPGSAAQEDDLASAAPPERRLPSDWSFEFGGGALALPSFPGAASTKVIPLPWVDLHYKDRLFLSPISGLGVNLVAVPGARLGVALLPDLGRSASSDNRLRGWGDIGAGADLRLFGQLRVLGPLAVLAGVRRQLGGGNGTVVDGGLSGTLRLLPRLTVTATGTVTWANARYTQAYFGVDAEQSATAQSFGSVVPAFAAGAGLRDTSLALSANLRLDHHWSLQSIFRTEALLGDAGRSPLTERRLQWTFGGFIAYRL